MFRDVYSAVTTLVMYALDINLSSNTKTEYFTRTVLNPYKNDVMSFDINSDDTSGINTVYRVLLYVQRLYCRLEASLFHDFKQKNAHMLMGAKTLATLNAFGTDTVHQTVGVNYTVCACFAILDSCICYESGENDKGFRAQTVSGFWMKRRN